MRAAEELKERVVRRELGWFQIQAAAFLGDPTALAVLARAPSTLRPYEGVSEPGGWRSWFRPRRRQGLVALEQWVRGVERWGHEAAIRVGLAAAELLLGIWEEHNPRRPEPRAAVEALALLLVEVGDQRLASFEARLRDAATTVVAKPSLPAPLASLHRLLALWLGFGCGQASLADLVEPTLDALEAAALDRVGRAAGDAAETAGKSHFQVWEAARAAKEAEARRVGQGAAEELLRAAIREALCPWVLTTGVELDPDRPPRGRAPQQVREALEPTTEPGSVRARRERDAEPLSVAESLLLGVLPLGAFVELGLASARRARPLDRHVIDDPQARWACPRCSKLNPNSTYLCLECGYKLQ